MVIKQNACRAFTNVSKRGIFSGVLTSLDLSVI